MALAYQKEILAFFFPRIKDHDWSLSNSAQNVEEDVKVILRAIFLGNMKDHCYIFVRF